MIIGITGGVGTGKSSVLQLLKDEFGAVLIIADDIARDLMEPPYPGYYAVVSHFGTEILQETGEQKDPPIDRGKLSQIVFRDPEKLQLLNHLIHPLVREEIISLISRYQAEGTELIVIETALLLQAGYQDLVDELWVLHTDYSVRLERLQASRGYSKEKTDSIIRNQLPDEEMEAAADFVIDNSKDLEDTRQQILRYLDNRIPIRK